MDDEDVDHVLELERELQTPQCRSHPRRLRTVLASDFREIGASGRVWDREAMIDHLQTDDPEVLKIAINELSGRRIVSDLILVTWVSEKDGERAWRTSLWRSTTHGWQLVHHQGTPIK